MREEAEKQICRVTSVWVSRITHGTLLHDCEGQGRGLRGRHVIWNRLLLLQDFAVRELFVDVLKRVHTIWNGGCEDLRVGGFHACCCCLGAH